MEVWKDVLGNSKYQISSLGRVRSMNYNRTGLVKVMRPSAGKGCYQNIKLRYNNKYKTKYIHHLVAESFLGHNPSGHYIVVDHINGDTEDNRLSNLRIVTQHENVLSSKLVGGSSKYPGVDWHRQSKKWRARIQINGARMTIGMYDSEEEAKDAYFKHIDGLLWREIDEETGGKDNFIFWN